MILVLLGPPGGGKGTQAKLLAQRLGLPHISIGDILRQNVCHNTELGKQAENFMRQGMLAPDALVREMLVGRLNQPDIKNGFILDGYPRNLEQARTLDELLKSLNKKIDTVLDLEVSEKVIIQRLSGRRLCKNCQANFHLKNMPPKVKGVCDNCGGSLYQRDDDKERTIRQRLEVYRREVSSIIQYYRQDGRWQSIAADEEAEIVLERIMELLKQRDDSLKV